MKIYTILLALIFSSGFSFAQNSPEQIIEKFFQDLTKEKPEKTLDNLYTHMPWVANIKSDIDKLKTQFANLQTYFGKYCGNVFINKKDIAGVFVAYCYLVKYERQPVRFTFKFYKPKDVFLVYSFSYDIKLEEEVEEGLKMNSK